MKRIRLILSNRKGEFAIIVVIIALMMVSVFTAYLNYMQSNFILKEIKSVMNNAGYSALKSAVEVGYHREEMLDDYRSIDKDKVSNKFVEALNAVINAGGQIHSFDITHLNVYYTDGDNWNIDDGKKRPQVVLEADARVGIKNISQDNDIKYFNVRSVSRLVYK